MKSETRQMLQNAETSFIQDAFSTLWLWPDGLRRRVGGRRGLIAVGLVAIGIGVVLNWSWFVAAGLAPVILALLPCAAMCALGLCMNKLSGKSRATEVNSADSSVSKVPAGLLPTDEPQGPSSTTSKAVETSSSRTNAMAPADPTYPSRGCQQRSNLTQEQRRSEMRTSVKTLVMASVLAAALFGAQALMAHQESGGMMGGGSMMGEGGDVMFMMNMIQQMSQMMDACNKMMQEHHGESQKPIQAATEKDKKQ